MTHDLHPDDSLLLRRLHGELSADEATALDERLGADEALSLRLAAFERAWNQLEAPPELALPAGFGAGVRRRARDARSGWRWSAAPTWARAGMAAALAVGLSLGVGLARLDASATRQRVSIEPLTTTGALDSWQSLGGNSLAEDYWAALDTLEDATVDGEEITP